MIYIKRKIYRHWIKKFINPTVYYTHQGVLQFISNMDCDAPFLLNVEICFFSYIKKEISGVAVLCPTGILVGLLFHVWLF